MLSQRFRKKNLCLKGNESMAFMKVNNIKKVYTTHLGYKGSEALRNVNFSDEKGEFVFVVNNTKVYAKGSNWVPADAFHSRDKERIPKMLELAEECGCNFLRLWGGNVYEDDLFYDICDRKGNATAKMIIKASIPLMRT